jgi:hypothetical protein
MIKVLRHGNTIEVENPVTGEVNVMINVTFIEEGRGGADRGMTETTAFLSQLTGQEVGLSQLRVHTHPVLASKIGLFPIGQEFPGHINRGLFSTPQIRQQIDKDPRIIDGKPTYFKTWISDRPEADVDMRVDNNILASVRPSEVFNANVGAANVRVLETAMAAGRTANPMGMTATHAGADQVGISREFIEGRPGQVGDATPRTPSGAVNPTQFAQGHTGAGVPPGTQGAVPPTQPPFGGPGATGQPDQNVGGAGGGGTVEGGTTFRR